MSRKFLAAATLAVGLTLSAVAGAQDLRIAVNAEPTSVDPMYHNLNPNNQVARQLFDQLIHQDEKQKLIPGLALLVEADRRGDVGVQAPAGRQVP